MRIGIKLTLTYIAISLLVVATGLREFTTARAIADEYRVLNDELLPVTRVLAELRAAGLYLHVASLETVHVRFSPSGASRPAPAASESTEQAGVAEIHLASARSHLDELLAEYERLVHAHFPEEAKLYRAVDAEAHAVFQSAVALNMDLRGRPSTQRVADHIARMEDSTARFLEAIDTAAAHEARELTVAAEGVRALIARLRLESFAISGAAVILALVIGLVSTRGVVRPIRELDRAVTAFGHGDFAARVSLPRGDELGELGHAFDEMATRIAEGNRQLQESRDSLRAMVVQRDAANKELEAFSYAVSHDLRAPLRGIDGFSQALLEDQAERLDDQGRHYLDRIRAGCARMGELINALLTLSRITRQQLTIEPVDVSALARSVAADLHASHPDRRVDLVVEDGLSGRGDPAQVRIVFENLLGNAWKFTAHRSDARVEVGKTRTENGTVTYFVRDNGAGFDMDHAEKLFRPFERLHTTSEFEGTGIGLATVQRVVRRHGGSIWGEGAVGEGATIYFTLADAE